MSSVDPEGHPASDVPNTASGWMTWLRSNTIVSVTSSTRDDRSDALAATYVDITDERGGEKFPDLITWPNAGPNVYGIPGDWIFRLYLADVTYDGSDHLLAVAVEATDASDLEAFLPVAEQLIASADAPIEAS